jgi:hypothetical protein
MKVAELLTAAGWRSSRGVRETDTAWQYQLIEAERERRLCRASESRQEPGTREEADCQMIEADKHWPDGRMLQLGSAGSALLDVDG